MAKWVVPPVTVTQTPPRDLFSDLEPPPAKRCSRDTNGDGDCGRPYCPECGPLRAHLCDHRSESKTLTVWPGETWERMTWTCNDCGHVRGRC